MAGKKGVAVKKPAEKRKRKSKPYPIVAIGASAGGLEAVIELLQNLPPDTGMAYVYIQHLDPTHPSMLSTILARHTKMKVYEAKDRIPIQANHVYVLPPNKEMSVIDGVLKLNPRPAKPVVHLPINRFFISLAEKQKDGAISIVLSGNANDGTLGSKAIKFAGGITFAQDKSAKYSSMPKSAIAEGAIDLILSPAQIAKELQRLGKQANMLHSITEDAGDFPDWTDDELNTILLLVKKITDTDFSHYKKNTISRRIARRMLLHRLGTLKEYAAYLRKHSDEANVLYQDLLINVTSFFRDAETCNYLKKNIIPRIIKSKKDNEPIRIWVPACSTGEEAYSLAIMLKEALPAKANSTTIQIFATDLSEVAVAKARLGLYAKSNLAEVSPQRLKRFFTKVDGNYRVEKSIRDLCIFAPHNVLKDPPFSKLDLVSCCNLLIYFDTVLQKKAISTFHYALKDNGYLVLGKSESIGASSNLFIALDKKLKVYSRKKDLNTKAALNISPSLNINKLRPVQKIKEIIADTNRPLNIDKVADIILLNNYTPASVVVNQDLDVLLFCGNVNMFLELSAGKASLNLLKIARPGLGFELRNGVHKAMKTGTKYKKEKLELSYNNEVHRVNIEVLPLKSENEEKHFLIVFEKSSAPYSVTADAASNRKSKQLEQELILVREDMRSVIEEQEAVNEELQSANEEIISTNEELQSINEELETAKEETESANEELITINTELQLRNEQLAEAQEYAEGVFQTISEALLIIGADFRIKAANGAFYKLFNVNEDQTLDKLVFELGNRQWDIETLKTVLKEVLNDNQQVHQFIVEHNFPGVGHRIVALNASKIAQGGHKHQFILMAIADITEQTQAQRIISEREAWFRNMANNASAMIWTAGKDKLPNFFNDTWVEFTGQGREYSIGKKWMENIHPDDLKKLAEIQRNAFEEENPYRHEYRMRRHDGEFRWVIEQAKPTYDSSNRFTGYIGTITEIHDQKSLTEDLEKRVSRRTRKLQEVNTDLQRSNSELEQFAYVASHDLQEPLRKIITFSKRLEDKFSDRLSTDEGTYIKKISLSAQRMTRLIDDLLNFGRVSKTDRQFTEVDLNKTVKKVLANFDESIKQKKALIEIGHLPAIEAIPVLMEQLFHNLLSNALKFSGKDVQPRIIISANPADEKDLSGYPELESKSRYIKITVSDNGIGFPQEFADQIFIIFQRLNNRNSYPGTGIGLALCRKIVTYHNGVIYARSVEGKGTEFCILLPMKQ